MEIYNTPVLKDLPKTLQISDCRSDRVLDHQALFESISERAEVFAKNGIGTGAIAVIGLPDPIDTLVSLFSCWANGSCAVLINPQIKEDEKERVANSVSPTHWIGDAPKSFQTSSKLFAVSPMNPEAPALILMTSGTTGTPKGIVHNLKAIQARLDLNIDNIGTDALRDSLCVLPVFFGHGLIGNCLTPLMAGQNLHMWISPSLTEYPNFPKILEDRKISFLSSVPSFWKVVLSVCAKPSAGPQRVHVGSAPLSKDLWEQIAAWSGTKNVFNMFGMTETANWISGASLTQKGSSDGFVGAPWGGTFAVLRDGQLHDSGQGQLAVKSPAIMMEYWQQDEKTREAFLGGYFLTGDIGQLSKDQQATLIGRKSHEINYGGIKILAEEVDMLLERHPNVVEACAFGIDDPMSGEVVAAVVKIEGECDANQITAWAHERARPEAVPKKLAILDEIPKSDRGKLVRSAVRDMMDGNWS